MAAPALAMDRRVPTLATVEYAYAVFQIKRDISALKPWQRWLFKYGWLPLMRFCVNRLHLPLVEKIDKVRCQHCGFNMAVEPYCWTEKEGIVTTREQAVEACKTSDWYFHKLRVNASMPGETAKKRLDHDFPKSNGHRSYMKANEDVAHVDLSKLEQVANYARSVNERAG